MTINKFFVLCTLFLSGFTVAQIINIPNEGFKERLLRASDTTTIARNLAGNYCKIDVNDDGEIQQSEALEVSYLNMYSTHHEYLSDLQGIQNFSNLIELSCYHNIIDNLDVSGMTNLQILDCSTNYMSALNLSGCTALQNLKCSWNDLSALDVSSSAGLLNVNCSYNNNIAALDLSHCSSLQHLSCQGNNLNTVNINNGANETLTIGGPENLEYVCADEFQIEYVQSVVYTENCTIDSSCSLMDITEFTKSSMAVYPNPAAENLNLVIDKNIIVNSIMIYDFLGQVVLNVSNANAVRSVDVSYLKSGNYLIRINIEEGILTGRFIKI